MLAGWRASQSHHQTAPQTEAALISNTGRGRSDHPHGRVGVAGAVEVDVNDPQDEQSNECGGDGFHDLLTMKIRHGFRGRNSHRMYEGTKGRDSERTCPIRRGHPRGLFHGSPTSAVDHISPSNILISAATAASKGGRCTVTVSHT